MVIKHLLMIYILSTVEELEGENLDHIMLK